MEFQPHTLGLILHYIVPPSSKKQIPHHLISQPLLQRHHFLDISPDTPHDYLIWPSHESEKAIAMLENYYPPADETEYATYPVSYTADPESAYAHIRITPDDQTGLRLVFQWDFVENQWKYHNVALMPFPPGSQPSVREATMSVIQHPKSHQEFLEEPLMNEDSEHNGDDAYWASYGQDDTTETRTGDTGKDVCESGEDAYWARYAAVQGTADSTIPSPLPIKRGNDMHLPNNINSIQPQSSAEPIVFSYSSVHPFARQDLASPNALTDRLNAISPRPEVASPINSHSPESLDGLVATDSSTPSPPPGLVKLGVKSAGSPERRVPIDLSIVTTPSLGMQSSQPAIKERQGGERKDEEVEALKESVRGVFRLWKAGRRKATLLPVINSPSQDVLERELFLSIAQQAIQNC